MKFFAPQPLPLQKAPSSWLWACVSLLILLSIFLATFWLPLPRFASSDPGVGAQEPAGVLPYHRRLQEELALRDLSVFLKAKDQAPPRALPGDRFQHLTLKGHGSADSFLLGWTSLCPDGSEQEGTMKVDLEPTDLSQEIHLDLTGQPTWAGAIVSFELTAVGGTFTVEVFEAR